MAFEFSWMILPEIVAPDMDGGQEDWLTEFNLGGRPRFLAAPAPGVLANSSWPNKSLSSLLNLLNIDFCNKLALDPKKSCFDR